MSKNYIIEKDFEHQGMRCVVVFQRHGHRCGYVGIPCSHPLYGKSYNDYLEICKKDIMDKEISGIFARIMTALDQDDRIMIGAYLNCHGGVTYSGGGENSSYPVESNLWWFGFDCAHCDDGRDLDLALELFPQYREQIMSMKEIEAKFSTEEVVRSTDYVANNCIRLAEQLIEIEKSF